MTYKSNLWKAVNSGNIEKLEEALQEISKAGIDINSEELSHREHTALTAAILKGHIPVINTLIAAGISLGKKDGETALMRAISYEQIGAAEVIIAASNRDMINLRNDDTDDTALHYAAKSFVKYEDKQRLITLLLEKGADPLLKNIFDKTAIDVVREMGNFECVTILNDVVRKVTLEQNTASRKFRIESGITALFDPPYGTIFLEKLDSEEKPNPRKIEQILMLLDFIDPQFLDTRIVGHTAQFEVELVDDEMNEQRDEDEVLRVLVNFIATDFEEDGKDALYKSLFALIHEKFYNKKYKCGDAVKTSAQIVCGDHSEYFNEMVDGAPVIDQTKLLQEIRLVMLKTISNCKSALEQEFRDTAGEVTFAEVGGESGDKKRKAVEVVSSHRAAKVSRAEGGAGDTKEPRRISVEEMTLMIKFIQERIAKNEETDDISAKFKEEFSLGGRSMVPRSSVAQPVALGMRIGEERGGAAAAGGGNGV